MLSKKLNQSKKKTLGSDWLTFKKRVFRLIRVFQWLPFLCLLFSNIYEVSYHFLEPAPITFLLDLFFHVLLSCFPFFTFVLVCFSDGVFCLKFPPAARFL